MPFSSRDCEEPSAFPKSANLTSFYRFVDQSKPGAREVLTRSSFKRQTADAQAFLKTEAIIRAASAQSSTKGTLLRGPAPKHTLVLEDSKMFGHEALDDEHPSAALVEQRNLRHQQLVNLTQSDVLFTGEETVSYPKKGHSKSGCPVTYQPTEERLFGDYFSDHPQSFVQIDKVCLRCV
jgi:hypothetical protein